MKRRALPLALILSLSIFGFAQHAPSTPVAAARPAEAQQFDFLLGHWKLEVHPKVSGLAALIHGTPQLVGTWKAWRAVQGPGIEDEMRIVDASGNPISLNRTQRVYDPAEGLWKISGRDVTRGRGSVAKGKWQDGEMHLDGQSTDGGGKILTRTRFYGITAEAFHMQQDRSTDGGQTWEKGSLTIDAKRVHAAPEP